MNKDTQKPILYKADPDLFVLLEKMKESDCWKFNRNQILNDAVRLYLELIKLMHKSEYAFLNEVSFNDGSLQRILYHRLKVILNKYPARRYREKYMTKERNGQ